MKINTKIYIDKIKLEEEKYQNTLNITKYITHCNTTFSCKCQFKLHCPDLRDRFVIKKHVYHNSQ